MTAGQLKGEKVLVLTETEFIAGEMGYYREYLPRLGATVDFAANLCTILGPMKKLANTIIPEAEIQTDPLPNLFAR